MKKPSQSQAASAAAKGVPDEAWAKKYPTIVEHLVTDQWEDGSAREVSALSIQVKDGLMALALNDKDLKQSLYTAAGSLSEALALMERALKDGSGQWRPWKSGKRK